MSFHLRHDSSFCWLLLLIDIIRLTSWDGQKHQPIQLESYGHSPKALRSGPFLLRIRRLPSDRMKDLQNENPLTNITQKKMGRKETIHLFKAPFFYLGDSCVAHPLTTNPIPSQAFVMRIQGAQPPSNGTVPPRTSLPCYMGYEKQPWTLNNPLIPQ